MDRKEPWSRSTAVEYAEDWTWNVVRSAFKRVQSALWDVIHGGSFARSSSPGTSSGRSSKRPTERVWDIRRLAGDGSAGARGDLPGSRAGHSVSARPRRGRGVSAP